MEEMLEILNELRTVEFKEFTKTDWYAFAGADAGSKIGYSDKFTFILSPTGNLSVVGEDGDETEIGVLGHRI